MKKVIKDYSVTLHDLCEQMSGPITNLLDFYLPETTTDSSEREKMIEDIESNTFIQNSPSLITIIDYEKRGYLYVSKNINAELNITAEEMLQNGLVRAFAVFEETHRNMFINHLYPTMFEHFAAYAPTKEAIDLVACYNTLLETADGQYQWFDHHISNIKCNEAGFPVYAMKILTNIDSHKKDELMNFRIYKKKSNLSRELIFSKDYGFDTIGINISEREKDIIRLIAEGLTSSDIADRLSLSTHTVSTHRKNIMKKTNTKSVVELLNFSYKHGII